MTEDEFVAWCDEDVKAEWVDGEVIIMGTASTRHVRLTGFVYRVFSEFVEVRQLGEVFGPELQIRLAAQRRRRVPDLFFVARERLHLLTPQHFEGVPDLIVEIVSPDSQARDWREKYLEYEAVGVREYWVSDPMSQRVEAYALGAERKFERIAEVDDRIASTVLPGLYLRPSWLFAAEFRSPRTVLREIGVVSA